MLVPDVLHEFELGVWKAIFTHLMRILYANGSDAIQKLNKRCVIHIESNSKTEGRGFDLEGIEWYRHLGGTPFVDSRRTLPP